MELLRAVMLAIVPIGQGLFYRLPVNQRKEVISFSQRTMRYFMLFVLNLVLRAKVSLSIKYLACSR